MKKTLIFLLVSYLLIGCGSESSTSKEAINDTLLFHLKVAPQQKEKLDTLLLSEIADSIQYTQLKTSTPITFFVNCDAENFIPILSGSIQLYKNSGEFLCNIGSAGRGHGEYIKPKWTVSEENNEIYIYSATTSPESLLVYGTDGKYKKKIENDNLKSNIDKILSVGNNIVITMPPLVPNYHTAELLLFDPITNSVIDSIANHNKIKSDDSFVNITFPVSVSSIYDDNLYYLSAFADTLYKISPTKIEPLVVFDYGEFKYRKDIITLRGEQYKEASNNTIKPMTMLATKRALYIQFRYSNASQTLSWITKLDLSSGSVENYGLSLLNDIDNGPEYILPYFCNYMIIDVATLLATNPEQVKKYKTKDAQCQSNFTKILNKSNENSNSVIIKPHIK